jgi:hypothetical protein
MLKDKTDYPLHVKQWKETGGSMAAYCKANDISYHTFIYHANRLKKREVASPEFIRFEMPEGKTVTNIEYHFANGNYFVFPTACSVQVIKTLIS